MSSADVTAARAFAEGMMQLDYRFNTEHHLNSASRAVFEVLSTTFEIETDVAAVASDRNLQHVYEWDMVGNPAGRLFQTVATGRGGFREVSWRFLPSKTDVPIDYEKYPDTEDFDPSGLNPHHVFVWKAPILEYGTEVTVRLKNAKALVIPNPQAYTGLGSGRYITDGVNSVLITKQPYTFSPGEMQDTVGNFTGWFMAWWAGGMAESVISEIFEPQRDNQFKTAYMKAAGKLRGYTPKTKVVESQVNAQAALMASRLSIEVSEEVERWYLSRASRAMKRNL